MCPEEPERLGESQLFSGTLKRPDGKILPSEELLHLAVLQCDLQQPSARPGKEADEIRSMHWSVVRLNFTIDNTGGDKEITVKVCWNVL